MDKINKDIEEFKKNPKGKIYYRKSDIYSKQAN
jgi:hypothetical protein